MIENRRIWTQNEKDKLRELWSPSINADPKNLDWPAVERIAKVLDRPPNAVYQRARDLGLLGAVGGRGHSGARAVEAARALQGDAARNLRGSLGASLVRRAANDAGEVQDPLPPLPATRYAPYLQSLLSWNEGRLKLARAARGAWAEMEAADRAAEVAALRQACEAVKSLLVPAQPAPARR